MDQVEATGAELFATTCSNCRMTLDDGQQHLHLDKKVQSLMEILAENLAQPHSAESERQGSAQAAA